MALDEKELATRAREHLTEQGEGDAGFTVGRLMSFIPDALKELGEQISNSGDFRLLQAEFAGTPTKGLLDIFDMAAVDPMNDVTRILFQSVEMRPQFRETNDKTRQVKFIRAPRRSAFYSSTTTRAGVVFYFIEGDTTIAFKGPNGKLPGDDDGYAIEVTATANVIPTLAIVDAKPVLRTPLVLIVADIALRGLKAQAARSAP